MLQRLFRLHEHQTTVRQELLAGLTTFLTMAYIIVVQPMVLTGQMTGQSTGMDFGAVMTATCLAAAAASALMGLAANYPIAQAPGMGQNFFFVAVALHELRPGQAVTWQTALGVVFVAGVLFLGVSAIGLRRWIIECISPSLKYAVAAGIGLFIAFIGLKSAGLVVAHPGSLVALRGELATPDVAVFAVGLLLMAALTARGVRGAIFWGIAAATLTALLLRWLLSSGALGALPAAVAESQLINSFQPASGVVSLPPSLGPTFLHMDLAGALAKEMIPFILIFFFMDVFDTLGTLLGVGQRAGLLVHGRLPRAQQAMLSDAAATVVGACLGTSTVTSYIESAAGVEAGGRTGLVAVTVAGLFLAALLFHPLAAMIGSYPPITAPALVLVGALMFRSAVHIAWDDASEAVPAFVVLLGIPLTFSIAAGIALGLVAYPLVKLVACRPRDVRPLGYLVAALLAMYLVFVHGSAT
jgi:AGZA family xanthine/uracil permease-like MFS transporter